MLRYLPRCHENIHSQSLTVESSALALGSSATLMLFEQVVATHGFSDFRPLRSHSLVNGSCFTADTQDPGGPLSPSAPTLRVN
jgi:hypothetical protein